MNKVAIVTGAAGNLGTSVIDQLIHEGYVIEGTVQNERDREDLSLRNGVKAKILNLTDEAATQAFVDSVYAKHGRIDACICLVGGYAMGDIQTTDSEALLHMYRLNFLTAYHAARPAYNYMKQKGYGRIVLIGAKGASEPASGTGALAYSLSKGQLLRLADILNEDGKERDVVTSVVLPSIIDTPANRQAMPKADFTKWVSPVSIAKQIAWLCSEHSKDLRNPVVKVFGQS